MAFEGRDAVFRGLTMGVLLLIVAGVTGIVLRLLLLVMPAAAAAAKHLVEEAELGAGEGKERQESYQEAHLDEQCGLWCIWSQSSE